MRRRHLAVRPCEGSNRARRHRRSVALHAGGAQVRAGCGTPGHGPCSSCGPQRRDRRTRQNGSHSPLWEGAVRQHGAADGVRYRLSQWLDNGATLVASGDASGEERLEVFAGAAARTLPWEPATWARSRRAEGQPARPRQPSQRSLVGESRSGTLTLSIAASTAAARISPGRPTAPGSPTRSGRARDTARSSSTTLAGKEPAPW